MITLLCPNCGSDMLIVAEEWFYCEDCDTEFKLEDAVIRE